MSRTPSRAQRNDHDEGPLPQDIERFNGVTRACPECGKEVFDDVTRCYHCGADMDAPRGGRKSRTPVWVAVTAAVVIAAFLVLFVMGLR